MWNEELLREKYMEKEELWLLYRNDKRDRIRRKRLLKKLMFEVFGFDFYPQTEALYSKGEALEYMKYMFLEELAILDFEIKTPNFNRQTFINAINDFFKSDEAEQVLTKTEWTRGVEELSELMNLPIKVHRNIQTFKPYIIFLHCIPIKNRYLVQGIYLNSFFCDQEILTEKLKTITLHYSPFSPKEMRVLNELYKMLKV